MGIAGIVARLRRLSVFPQVGVGTNRRGILVIVSMVLAGSNAIVLPATGASGHGETRGAGESAADRFDAGDLLTVEWEENGTKQSALGFVVEDRDRYINVEMPIAGRMATKTILRSDLRRAEVKARSIRADEAAWSPDLVAALSDKSQPLELRTSAGLRAIAARFGSIDLSGRTVILHVDALADSDEDVLLLLHSLSEARERGMKVIAVFERAEANAAVIALACDAMIPVGSGIIGASRRTAAADDPVVVLLACLACELGFVDRQLPIAMLGVSGGLGWSKELGFAAKADELSIATPESPAKIEARDLVMTGLASIAVENAEQARALVESGQVKARGEIARAAPSRVQKDAPKARPAAEASETRHAAIAAAIAEYNSALRTLHADIPEFNLYFTGQKGVWTEQLKSLRAIWERKAEMTAHVNTQMEVARLQKSMLRCVGVMENLGRRLQMMIDQHGHPTLAEHRARLDVFLVFKGSILRNRADDYVRSSNAIAGMKTLPAPAR